MFDAAVFIEATDLPGLGLVDVVAVGRQRFAVKRAQHPTLDAFEQIAAVRREQRAQANCGFLAVFEVREHSAELITETLFALPIESGLRRSASLRGLIVDYLHLLAALVWLQVRGLFHGDVRPTFVARAAADGRAALIDRLSDSLSALQCQARHVRNGDSLYLPPRLFAALLGRKAAVAHNPYQTDAFALAMLFLESAVGGVQTLYSRERGFDGNELALLLDRLDGRGDDGERAFAHYLRVAALGVDEANVLPPRESLAFLSQLRGFESFWQSAFGAARLSRKSISPLNTEFSPIEQSAVISPIAPPRENRIKMFELPRAATPIKASERPPKTQRSIAAANRFLVKSRANSSVSTRRLQQFGPNELIKQRKSPVSSEQRESAALSPISDLQYLCERASQRTHSPLPILSAVFRSNASALPISDFKRAPPIWKSRNHFCSPLNAFENAPLRTPPRTPPSATFRDYRFAPISPSPVSARRPAVVGRNSKWERAPANGNPRPAQMHRSFDPAFTGWPRQRAEGV